MGSVASLGDRANKKLLNTTEKNLYQPQYGNPQSWHFQLFCEASQFVYQAQAPKTSKFMILTSEK